MELRDLEPSLKFLCLVLMCRLKLGNGNVICATKDWFRCQGTQMMKVSASTLLRNIQRSRQLRRTDKNKEKIKRFVPGCPVVEPMWGRSSFNGSLRICPTGPLPRAMSLDMLSLRMHLLGGSSESKTFSASCVVLFVEKWRHRKSSSQPLVLIRKWTWLATCVNFFMI